MGCDETFTPTTKDIEAGQDMGSSAYHASQMFPQHERFKYQPVEVPDDMNDETADHLVAETIGGTSRSVDIASIAGIGRTMPHADFYKPHKYSPTAEGLLGAPCLFCGGSSGAPPHVEWDKMQQEPEPLPEGQIRVQAIDDKVAGNVIRIEIDNPPTQEARDILTNVLPGVLEAWLKKNADYGDSDELKSLGARAEFVRLWNKMMKLKAGLWEGRELSGEQLPEIMGDMVAHLLLALSRL